MSVSRLMRNKAFILLIVVFCIIFAIIGDNGYTITFDTDGGSEIAPITQEAGTKVVTPTAPVKTGYTFIGWEPEIPEMMPPKNITLKALWKRDLSDTPKTGVSQPSNTGVSSVTGAGSSGNAPAATPSDEKTNDTSPTVTAVNGDTPAPPPPRPTEPLCHRITPQQAPRIRSLRLCLLRRQVLRRSIL